MNGLPSLLWKRFNFNVVSSSNVPISSFWWRISWNEITPVIECWLIFQIAHIWAKCEIAIHHCWSFFSPLVMNPHFVFLCYGMWVVSPQLVYHWPPKCVCRLSVCVCVSAFDMLFCNKFCQKLSTTDRFLSF